MISGVIEKPWNENAYYQEEHLKDLVVWHHTDGRANAMASANYLEQSSIRTRTQGDSRGRRYSVSVPWWIDRDGTIINTFDDRCWGHHNGAGAAIAKRSIAIEFENLGVLFKRAGVFFNRYGEQVNTKRYRVYRHYEEWRGSQYFEIYHEALAESLITLMDDIFRRHPGIPRQIPKDLFPEAPWPIAKVARFKGILTHAHTSSAFPLRFAKFDISVAFNAHINRVCRDLGIIRV